MTLYQRILGHPFVYDRVRPLVVGGIDWSPLYRNLDVGPSDVILDVGCGTGVALQYLTGFGAYHGFDTDESAIESARKKTSALNVNYECRLVTPADIKRIAPTRIVLAGLLHHLTDDECLALLQMCAKAISVRRIATSDPVHLPRRYLSNLLTLLDRGKFVRKREQYLDLPRRAGLRVVREELVRSHPRSGIAMYLMMTLAPPTNPLVG
jgi:2-polyprenyl-3-methyl-5-hydroxy-6-metoxy-1,4-benzoquinol methylase